MKLVSLRLYGGLGNQIFQISAAILICKDSGISKINIDDSHLNHYLIGRENNLELFFDFKRIDIDLYSTKSFVHSLRLAKLFRFNSMYVSYISDGNFFDALSNRRGHFGFLDGYFQYCLTQTVFDEQVFLLKKCFKEKSLDSSENSFNNECVIHIRGGDFVALGWDLVTPLSYYREAISYFSENHSIQCFNIVTDDVVYASKITESFSGIDFKFIGGNQEDDFYIIRDHKFRILSSSTFAFWASALSNIELSVVIAPSFWKPNTVRNILLPNEVRLKGY